MGNNWISFDKLTVISETDFNLFNR